MSRVAVNTSVLHWALDRIRTPAVIENRFPKLSQWLEGKEFPTLRQLEAFAKATSTPLGYFFLPAPPEDHLPIPHYRTLGDKTIKRPSPDLLETVQTMERRQTWMREYLVEQGIEPLKFIASTSASANPVALAHEMRDVLGISENWAASQPTWTAALRNLEQKMEDAGILVVVNGIVGNNTHRKLNPTEFRGFVLVDEYAPLVFVNGADGKAAQMFTLAHELAHLWLGSSAAFDLRQLMPSDDATEQACNRIAAEFLVPAASLRTFWPSIRNAADPFQKIARKFKVSVLVAARLTSDLELITRNAFFEFYRAYQERERRVPGTAQEGGDFYATQNLRIGKRFTETVVRATLEGKLLYHQAYQLTGLHGNTFERYAGILGFSSRENT